MQPAEDLKRMARPLASRPQAGAAWGHAPSMAPFASLVGLQGLSPMIFYRVSTPLNLTKIHAPQGILHVLFSFYFLLFTAYFCISKKYDASASLFIISICQFP